MNTSSEVEESISRVRRRQRQGLRSKPIARQPALLPLRPVQPRSAHSGCYPLLLTAALDILVRQFNGEYKSSFF